MSAALRASERPKPAGMIVGSTVILRMLAVWLTGESPFAAKSVANGGSSALLAAISSLPSIVRAISSARVDPPVLRICLVAVALGESLLVER